jgi:succinoglycan biosynthesis protein ExoM
MLERLLKGIESLRTEGLFTIAVVVIDNDSEQSAKDVVDRISAASRIPLRYDVEMERSIALARNRSVKNADGEFIAFIDDDEFADEEWLLNHYKALRATNADGVLGPVKPYFGPHAPAWLIKSGLCDRSRFATGTVLRDSRHTRTGNVLIRRDVFSDPTDRFDPQYGRSGGSDAVFFKRMIEKGKVFVWCDEACVYEAVPRERQTRSYYLKRAYTRGMTEAWNTPFLRLGTLRSIAAIILYTAALPFLFLVGHHLFMRYLVKNCDHVAKLLGYAGIKLVAERPYSTAA